MRFETHPLPAPGVSHAHFRSYESGFLLRTPRGAALGIDLTHQAICFQRAEPSTVTPRLFNPLPPTSDHPLGGLIIEEIQGHPPTLPDDLPIIAQTLAALHRLPLPPPEQRPPLASPPDPMATLVRQTEAQTAFFNAAGLSKTTLQRLREDMEQARKAISLIETPAPTTLIGVDTHPGNFLIDAQGKGWFVDLEKLSYGCPMVDLAHAELPTSLLWASGRKIVLSPEQSRIFYETWMNAVPSALAQMAAPWREATRQWVRLRSLSWMARWRALTDSQIGASLPPLLRREILERIEQCFQCDAPQT
ncbi:Aminoglycoside phosphotransferase [Azospirillaceae bacterium]